MTHSDTDEEIEAQCQLLDHKCYDLPHIAAMLRRLKEQRDELIKMLETERTISADNFARAVKAEADCEAWAKNYIELQEKLKWHERSFP